MTQSRVEYFDKLFHKYYASLLAFANSYISNRDEAWDIVQTAFIKLWEKGEFYREEQVLKSFLFTCTKNLTLDALKHKKVQAAFNNVAIETHREIEQELVMDALREFNAWEIEDKGVSQKVKRLVMHLPFSDRRIFILSKYDNLTNQEIADLLGISVKTVEKRLKISINFIRKKITIIILFV